MRCPPLKKSTLSLLIITTGMLLAATHALTYQ
ncbi:hypothetical protein ACVW0A_001448 [Pseudomonas sp. TE3610]